MMPRRPLVAAFYSYKGGVGRTTALYHTASALARAGRRLVLVDLDLSAPSLWALAGHSRPDRGFVEYLHSWITQSNLSAAELLTELKLPPSTAGSIFLLEAGRMDVSYLETLQTLDWLSVVNQETITTPAEHGTHRTAFFDQLVDDLTDAVRPDAILVDAPTGFNDTSNLILRLLADLVVLIFSPTRVQLEGIGRVVSLLTTEQQRSRSGAKPSPSLLGVASTILTPTIGSSVIRRVRESFEFLDQVRWGAVDPTQLTDHLREELRFDIATIPYDPTLAYLEHPDWEAGTAVGSPFTDIISYIQSALPESIPDPEPRLDDKRPLLAELKPQFQPFAEDVQGPLFLRTSHVDECLNSRVVLVLGGKGSGKTALFQYVTQQASTSHRRVLGVHGPRLGLGPDTLSHLLDGAPEAQDAFWRTYLLSAINPSVVSDDDFGSALRSFNLLQRDPGQGDASLLGNILSFLNTPNAGMRVNTAWHRVDQQASQAGDSIVLCLDGLDAAFKNDLLRRERALAALMVGWQETFAHLEAVQLKIFLRNDLWDQLTFPEKSHLRGRDMKLTWGPLSLWQMVVKRALASERFLTWASRFANVPIEQSAVEAASIDSLVPYLDRLFERHIWTRKNALSRNWILSRLADALGTIYPRDLLSLLLEAMGEEDQRLQQRQTVSATSVISRQSLPEALGPTSRQRVEALEEEYPDLKPVLESLRGLQAVSDDIGTLRQKVAGSRLGEDQTLQVLSSAGFVRFEESGGYRVPDLYRHGLDMTRMGPR